MITRKNWLRFGLLVLAIYTVIRFGILGVQPPGKIPTDLLNFYVGVDRLNAGELVYQPKDWSPFKYSPTFLVLFSWTFYLLGQKLGWLMWCALSVLGFAWMADWLWRNAFPEQWENRATPKGHRLKGWQLSLLISAFFVFGWHGFIEHFSYGQGDFLIFTAFLGSVALVEKRRNDAIAALVLSVCLITKPQSAILLSYFFIRRKWTLLLSIGVCTVALLFSPALAWGWPRLLELFSQWQFILQSQSADFLTGNLNQNLAASLARLFNEREAVKFLSPMFLGLGAISMMVLTWFWKTPSTMAPQAVCRLVCVVLMFYSLVSPLSWRWSTFIWIPVGVICSVDAIVSRKRDALRDRRSSVVLLVLLGFFALNGLLIQKIIAHRLGIQEVDDLSRVGLYCLGNILLFAASCLVLRKYLQRNEKPVSSSNSRD
ncbi:MAG: glycosyltransferase family 87 protein [Bdellovibrionota bacterium]